MKASILRAAAAAAFLCASAAQAQDTAAQQGKLLWRDDTCYFFVLKLDHGGFGLYEFLGGPSPQVGHVFEGNLQTFGTRKITNATESKPTMVYSETFTDTKAQMEKKIPRQCRKKKSFEELVVE